MKRNLRSSLMLAATMSPLTALPAAAQFLSAFEARTKLIQINRLDRVSINADGMKFHSPWPTLVEAHQLSAAIAVSEGSASPNASSAYHAALVAVPSSTRIAVRRPIVDQGYLGRRSQPS